MLFANLHNLSSREKIYTVYSNGKQKTAYFTKLHLFRERFIWLVFVTKTCGFKAFHLSAGNGSFTFLFRFFDHMFKECVHYIMCSKNSLLELDSQRGKVVSQYVSLGGWCLKPSFIEGNCKTTSQR